MNAKELLALLDQAEAEGFDLDQDSPLDDLTWDELTALLEAPEAEKDGFRKGN